MAEIMTQNIPGPSAGWHLELSPWQFWNQTADPARDHDVGSGPNAQNDCGPESLAMCLWYLTNVELDADYIWDTMRPGGELGYTSIDDLQQFLQRYCSIPVDVVRVSATWNAGSAEYWLLLSHIYLALEAGHPLIGLYSFTAPNSDDGHFRAIYGMTGTGPHGGSGGQGHVLTADPATGQSRVETYAEHWGWSKGIVLHLKRKRCVIA
jgi:hypothetical protein